MSLHTPPATEPVGGPGYERRDVNLRAILWLIFSVGVLIVGSAVGLRFLQRTYESQAQRTDVPLSPLQAEDQTPPAPRLQNTPIRDFDDYRAEQDAQLESYGWINKEQGTVRLPVARAMELALERGLPQPKAQPPQSESEAPSSEESSPPSEER